MITATCPNGHTVDIDARFPARGEAPMCETCNLIATHFNGKTGQVFTWTDIDEHHEACSEMQDAMNSAFDNQYFSEGW